jgi:Ni/Co efflux regulator RcnB
LKYTAALTLSLLVAGPAFAQPANKGPRFEDHQHTIVRDYYREASGSKRCPPGLAKKNNGCMPPGQAKKWQVGQRLPRNLAYSRVPQEIAVQLGTPPEGHRYVRIASDILLITQGAGQVIDAIIGVDQ